MLAHHGYRRRRSSLRNPWAVGQAPRPPVPAVVGEVELLPFTITDAVYSASLNRVVVIESATRQLHILDLATGESVALQLERRPTAVALSPDGRLAAVGHDAQVSYIDLVAGRVLKLIDVPINSASIAIGRDGWIYMASQQQVQQSLYAIDPDTGHTKSSNTLIYVARLRFEPTGTYLYSGDSDSARGMGLWRLTSATSLLNEAGLSRHKAHMPTCGDFWISADSTRIVTACGDVVNAIPESEQELGVLGKLEGLHEDFFYPQLRAVFHVEQAGRLIAIPRWHSEAVWLPGENQLIFYDYPALRQEALVALPDMRIDNQLRRSSGRFIFAEPDGMHYIVLVQAEAPADRLATPGVPTSANDESTLQPIYGMVRLSSEAPVTLPKAAP
ncbi:MAG: hypothetical protein HGA45_26055 [Chloroflexales bacterium]|nr:hypothetical protein [Chloroflexales bacterium]